jgi:hypothetical protein
MIEVHMTWDFVPGVDRKAYGEWAKKAIGGVMQSPGLIEFRANRNLAGSPQVLIVSLWESMTDYGKFAENVWPPLESEGNAYFQNMHYVIWGTSPVVPQPLRPAK